MFDHLDLNSIRDETARQLIRQLLNLIEKLTAELREAQAEIQRLRDEVNHLKGEQGKPQIKGNTPKPPPTDHSSEKERQKRRRHMKSSKKAEITIHSERKVAVDRSQLPADAQFKGYVPVVVQDVLLQPNNIRFLKEKYYCPSTGKTYLAPLPEGYVGQFGPGIRTLALDLYFDGHESEPKILNLLKNLGVRISPGEVSALLIKDQDEFHAEGNAVYEAGLGSSPWQHVDDTQTRVDGQNQHCHVVCNPVYTAYHTRPSKERLTVLDILRNGRPRMFRLNGEALNLLEGVPMRKSARQFLQVWSSEQDMDEAAFLGWLETHLPKLSQQSYRGILDAAAIAAYHAQKDFPVIRALVCDDAPQFNWLTEAMMLCWVHEGRAYKKLIPVVALHRQLLDDFLKHFWTFYDQLLAYREKPTQPERTRLEAEFDALFATHTGYDALDERIAKSRAKKNSLLLVLDHPELPLHNNPAELGARRRVRKRDVSFGPRTAEGVQAWDTFMTLAATTQKLEISFYQYIHDRIAHLNQIPPLADLVIAAAKKLNLGWSWPSDPAFTPSY
jgi:hypothetical protein